MAERLRFPTEVKLPDGIPDRRTFHNLLITNPHFTLGNHHTRDGRRIIAERVSAIEDEVITRLQDARLPYKERVALTSEHAVLKQLLAWGRRPYTPAGYISGKF